MSKINTTERNLPVVIEADEIFSSLIAGHVKVLFQPNIKVHEALSEVVGDKTLQVLVVLVQPVEALARRLSAGLACADGLSEWKAEADAFLVAARRRRRQLVLIDARALLSNDSELIAELDFKLRGEAHSTASPALPDPGHLVLADTLLRRDEAATRLLQELEALRRGPHEILPNASHLEEARSDLQASKIGQIELELLRENVALHLEAAKKSGARLLELEEECEALRQAAMDRHAVKAKSDALEHRLEESDSKSAHRETILGRVMLEDQRKLQAAYARGDALNRELSAAREELSGIYGSRSWLVTKPLRAVRGRGKARPH